MISVSETIKTNCNSETISYREYIVLTTDLDTQIDIKGQMSNSAYKNTTFFGTFNLKMLKFTTENDIDYRKKAFIYYKEINGEDFKIGSYIVTDISDSDSTEEVTVTAMDYGLNFAIPYVSDLDYSSGTITLFNVLQECCENAGITLKTETIENYGFIVDSNQFTNNETIGNVVCAIAQMSGNFATINEDSELELIFNTTTDEIIEDYTDLIDKRDTRPITIVTLGLSEVEGNNITLRDEELIALYGENYLIINDNPFAYTQEKRAELITAIFNKVKGFGYSSFESFYSFKPYLQLGDLIQFKNKNGDLVNSIVLKIDTNYDDIKLSAPSITDATIDYELPLDAYTRTKQLEIIVDNQAEEITLINSQTTIIQSDLASANNQISENTDDINNLNESNLTTQEQLAQIQISLTEITNTVQIQGGSNMVENSVMLLGTNLYTVTDTQATEGTIISGKITDLIGKSDSESGYILYNKKVVHDITRGFVVGKQYTITFKYSNQALNNLKVTLNNLDDEIVLDTSDVATLTEVVYTFIAKSNEISFSVESDYADDTLISLITDFIIKSGNVRADWEPAIGEIIGTNLIIYYNGVKVTSPGQFLETNINNLGFIVTNTSNGSVVLQCTKDGIITNDLTVNGKIYHGSFVIQQLTIGSDTHWMVS